MSLMLSGAARRNYAGDPGIWGRIGGALKGAAVGLVSGGPAGAVAGGVIGAAGAGGNAPTSLPGGGVSTMPPSLVRRTGGGSLSRAFRGGLTSLVAGPPNGGPDINLPNLPGFGRPGAGVTTPFGRLSAFEENGVGMKLACPSGYHPNKSDYFLRDGTFVPKGSKCVKNRRRNALNPRALDRAISRVGSAKKAAKMLGRVTIRSKKTC